MTKKDPKNKNSDSLVDQIYNQILSSIQNRGIVRAEKLSALSLSEQLGVSRTPVSFALYRLEIEGLISGEEKGGWVVNPLTLNDLDEIYEIKEKIYPLIVFLAAQNISPSDNAKLFIFVDEINRAIKWNDFNSWRAADKGFNSLLEANAGNKRLGAIERVVDNQLYILLTTYLSLPSSNKEIFDLYQDIASEVSSGNADMAKEKALQLINVQKKSLRIFLKEVVMPLFGSK